MKHIDVYNTHIEVYPYKKDELPIIEDMYTATDRFTNKQFPCGYMIDNEKLYLPRGTSISKLEHLLETKATINDESDPISPMSLEHSSIYDPRNKVQEESIKFLKDGGAQLGLNLKTGIGKATPLTTPIPTPDGWTTMGDLHIGSVIFGSDGKPTKVTGLFPQGNLDVYDVTFHDGRVVRCCANHLWKVSSAWKPNEWEVKMLKDIATDYSTYAIQVVSNPVEYTPEHTRLHPYVMGVLISNWRTMREQRIKVTNKSVLDKMRELSDYTFIATEKDSVYQLFGYDNALGDISDGISIPDEYTYNDCNTRMELLRGLMDSSGWISGLMHISALNYMAPNEVIGRQFEELIYGLGWSFKKTGLLTYQLHVPNADKMKFFSIPELRRRLYNVSTLNDDMLYDQLEIVDIQYAGVEECQCITVSAKDHLYLTNDFIVTHNTFCVAYASTELSEKTIIITPNESLKQQWLKTYNTMFDYRPKNLMNIAGSNIIEDILDEKIPTDQTDVFFVNHQTLRSFISQTNGYQLHNFFKKIQVGIKVYDESHMEFGNILLIDFFSNTKRTWYLTATFDRSDKTESACFKRAFQTVDTYGDLESAEVVRKHVVYHVVNFNSRIEPAQRAKLLGYPGFSAGKYGTYSIFEDKNETLYHVILDILKKTKDVEGKTLIFLPLIDCVDRVVEQLKKDFPEKSIAAYHSKIPKDEKEVAEKQDVIVSTIKSCGTGRDIKRLRIIICAEPVVSKVVTEQVIGRLRPYAPDKDTLFFDLIDRSISQLSWWYRARFRKIESLVKDVVQLNM